MYFAFLFAGRMSLFAVGILFAFFALLRFLSGLLVFFFAVFCLLVLSLGVLAGVGAGLVRLLLGVLASGCVFLGALCRCVCVVVPVLVLPVASSRFFPVVVIAVPFATAVAFAAAVASVGGADDPVLSVLFPPRFPVGSSAAARCRLCRRCVAGSGCYRRFGPREGLLLPLVLCSSFVSSARCPPRCCSPRPHVSLLFLVLLVSGPFARRGRSEFEPGAGRRGAWC